MAEPEDDKSVALRPVSSPFHPRDTHDDLTTDDADSTDADDKDDRGHAGEHDPPSEPQPR